ncbi:hypothetical protein ACFL2X_01750 [Candidatus Latescibacterota bacterium]
MRADHPRIFFNADTFPAIKKRALNEESELFSRMKARSDKLILETEESKDYGIPAAEAAFVYLVTGEEKYCALAKDLIAKSLAYYHQRYAEEKTVSWYSWTRINALAAYDWIFSEFSDAERREMGVSFLQAVMQVQPTDTRHYFYPQENWSGTTTGFYGNRSLLWYSGLATYGAVEDSRAESYLAEGYRLHMELLEHRQYCASDDGGSATTALNYAAAAYPWSVNNFFHTYRSATGVNIALDWPHVSYFTGYLYWNMLPGRREFGIGDSYHSTNKLSLNNMKCHLEQIIHFNGNTNPRNAAFGKWMIDQVPEGNYGSFPYTPILLTERFDDLEKIGPAEAMPFARHFENMGQVFMRSGAGANDSYALFMAGGVLEQHKHWDNNHFSLFKKGFLALDTGSRPPGQHTQHYYPRTVAHNCVLIHMPDEELPIFVDKGAGGGQRWGAPAEGETERPIPNDGGQMELMGSHVAAFETHDDYSYVAGDATKSYSDKKCRLALRQFVFLNPDYFVVFDRVTSVKPEYKKTWLLHTATEPDIKSQVFTAYHEDGRLYSKTLLPENADLVKIGGPGKQFYVDGHNYPMPEGNSLPDSTQLLGQWRVEVSVEGQDTESYFLHLIQLGDKNLSGMVESELVRTGTRVGVRFGGDSKEWEVTFGTEGDASGHVTIRENGAEIVNRELIQTVAPQMGLFGSK